LKQTSNTIIVSKWIEAGLDPLERGITGVAEGFFSREHNDGTRRWLRIAWILGLYLAGIAAWGVFFKWGSFSLNFHDWYEITAPRFAFLKDAVTRGLLPLHISDTMTFNYRTDRYLSVPDVFLSPQAILLRFMSVGHFVLADVWMMYTLGFLGLLWLQRKFRLSSAALAALFLVFNFNGHVLAHYSVGHVTWGGYFLFPWFVIQMIRLLDGQRGWTWVAETAGLLVLIVLQGSFHQFTWCLLFLGFLALSDRRAFFPAVEAAGFSVALNLFRIVPIFLTSSLFKYPFIGGYSDLTGIWDALVNIENPQMSIPATNGSLGSWEVTIYVGLVGAGFLLYFGFYRWMNPRLRQAGYQQLLLPVMGLIILSFGFAFGSLRDLLPSIFAGVRVVSRIFSLPFTFLAVFAAVEFQGWLEGLRTRRLIPYAAVFAAMIVEAFDLAKNFNIWMMTNTMTAFSQTTTRHGAWIVANHADRAYFRYLSAGLAGTLFSLTVLAGLLIWERKRRKRIVDIISGERQPRTTKSSPKRVVSKI
jgi:hypothetical protein